MCIRKVKRPLGKLVSLTLLLTLPINAALADGNSGKGADMWTGYFESKSLFVPHNNFCDASEAFVAVAPTGEGFCIEEDERSAAAWEEARNDCASDSKRLPEPGEWKYSCTRAGALGLNNMTNGWEWVSNFSSQTFYNTSAGGFGTTAPVGGNSSCHAGSYADVLIFQGSSAATNAYRCVR